MKLIHPFILILCLFSPILSANAADQPNIVLILSDDQGWTDYGFMGHEHIKTPNLDKLASRSAVFKRGYVPTALCRPSLMTLITGLYPHQHGVTGNDPFRPLDDKHPPGHDKRRAHLISKVTQVPTATRLLAKQGYLSHQSGKWWEGNPIKQAGFTHCMTRGFPQPGGRHGDDGLKIGREGMGPVFDFIDQALEKKKPFFVWYAPFLPHKPHTPPARILKKYEGLDIPESFAKYYAMCEWFDETCGQLIDHIDEKGLTQNTLFVYVSDNGWLQSPRKNGSFLVGSKQAPQDMGVRSPILYSWLGKIKAGERNEVLSSIDFMPTVLSAAGAGIPEALPGLDLMPLLRDGKKLDREAIFGESFAVEIPDIDKPEKSLLYRWCIEGKWKLILTYDGKVGRYGRFHKRENPEPLLYDLLADPMEANNLAAKNPETVRRLAKRIDANWHLKQAKLLVDLP